MATLLAILAFLVLPDLAAQAPRGGGPGRMRAPDPILFNGPPTPEDFVDLIGLDSAQYDSYRHHYTTFMETTRPQRDSLLEARRQMRDAMARGDFAAGMYGGGRSGGQLQKTMEALEKRQKAFDEELKPLLREPQIERYVAWRKEEMAKAEREMRERFGRPQ